MTDAALCTLDCRTPEEPARYEVITDWSNLTDLKDEWNLLWQGARRAFVLQSFAVVDIIRRVPLHQHKIRLWCLTGRVQGRLVLVWPFMIYWNHGWRLAAPLASEIDCSDPLIIDGVSHLYYARDAWMHVLRECPCDLFQFQFVRRLMPLHDLIRQASSRVLIYELELPLVDPSEGWRAYEDRLSRKQHSGFARKRRRLLELGRVTFERLPYDTPGLAGWIVDHKKKWLAKTGWDDKIQLTRPLYPDFLDALLRDLGPDGRCQIFAIRQRDRLVAVDINFVDQRTLQWYVGTFDEDFHKYSPGQLLKEFVVRWAFDHGLLYDMLGGTGQHKNYLATTMERVTTWRVGRTMWGRCYVALRQYLLKVGLLK